ncbi:gag-pol polyprotein [Echinococcus granulosus]|uniref:Gag-pol polyprotein n=1 Tax=Echinococcus granulosus TaxID=6210 RepID=W6UY51_ECHGR|nr:gag-pol polyprotein [Echinococcus granulosus]EUB58484.1 gag-pol polyprotein [Echinococcus granulosus]
MGSSGCSTSVTSSIVSGAGLDDTSTQPPITTHLKLIELSEALAAHNASAAAALRLTNQESVTSVALHPPPFSVTSRVSEAAVPADRERRKSTTTSRYLISGPLPPPPTSSSSLRSHYMRHISSLSPLPADRRSLYPVTVGLVDISEAVANRRRTEKCLFPPNGRSGNLKPTAISDGQQGSPYHLSSVLCPLPNKLARRERFTRAMQNLAPTRILLPAFWPDQVQLWFAACEAQFAAYGIHNQHARYSCVLALLKPEDLSLLSDLILNPDPIRPYDRLKAGLIQRSHTAQWRSARNEVPSAIVHRIRHALYEKAVDADETALKEMIVPFLPPTVRSVLEPVKETATVDQLVQMADRMMAMKMEGEALEAAFGEMVSQQQRQTWQQKSGRSRRRSTSRRPRAPPQRLLLYSGRPYGKVTPHNLKNLARMNNGSPPLVPLCAI